MPSVFLSYAREDAPKAQALAKCLERAGHSVWWDRHIHGGSEFAGEIEQALRSSDVVIVLWSEASLRSAWVRDEAAEGRDSGRLLPLLLDNSAPPLGFRQLQSVDISGWSGRGNPPAWQDTLAAVAARSGKKAQDTGADQPRQKVRARTPLAIAAAALGALVLALGAWWLLEGPSQAEEPRVLAVLPFSDLSPERDKAYFAEGVAEAILSVLAKEPGIRVVGTSTARQLHDAGPQAGKMRRELGITHILEGTARSVGDELRMSVRLIDASDGQQLWAEEYQRRLDNVFAVQDDIGRSVAQKLRGSFDGALSATPMTKADIYTLYLAARAKMRDRRKSSLNDALQLARRVITADPSYAPGHALFAELVWHLSSDNYGTIPEAKAKAVAQRHARRAVQLAPNAADGYAALGLSLGDTEAAIEPLTKAIALDPSRAELRQWLGHSLVQAGRQVEALSHFKAAVEMDPLWNPGAMLLAYTLAASERFDEAERSVAEFERRGGSRAVAVKIRGDIANYRGDYSEAARLSELALAMDPETPQADLSAGWYFYMLGLSDRAAAATNRLPRYTRLLMSGRQNQLLSEVRAVRADIWQQPDPSAVMEALSYARDWRTISALYDANRDIVAVICKDGEAQQMGLQLAIALENMKRSAESVRIRRCVRAMLELQGRGPIRSPYLPTGVLDIFWAQLHALDGNSASAFSRINRSIELGFRTPHTRGLSDLPAFDRFKDDPRYRQLDTRLKRQMALDRAEYLRQRRAA